MEPPGFTALPGRRRVPASRPCGARGAAGRRPDRPPAARTAASAKQTHTSLRPPAESGQEPRPVHAASPPRLEEGGRPPVLGSGSGGALATRCPGRAPAVVTGSPCSQSPGGQHRVRGAAEPVPGGDGQSRLEDLGSSVARCSVGWPARYSAMPGPSPRRSQSSPARRTGRTPRPQPSARGAINGVTCCVTWPWCCCGIHVHSWKKRATAARLVPMTAEAMAGVHAP